MKALVLGGNGFIGSSLVDRLVAVGYKVRVYGRSPLSSQEQRKNVEYLCGTLSETALVKQALDKIDVVFHLISTTIPSTSNLNPIDDIQDNLADTVGLLECMREIGIFRIVYISSGGTIYGESEKELIDEEHSLNPNCSYGIVKLAVEKYLNMYARLYQFKPVILRVSNPYGPKQKKIGLQGLIGTVLANAIKSEPIEVWGNGEVIRDYIFIDDVVSACICAIESNVSGVFNIGSGVGFSVNQVVKKIEALTAKKIEVKYTKSRNIDVNKVVLNIGKAKRELGWEPKIDISEGLKEHYKWLLSS